MHEPPVEQQMQQVQQQVASFSINAKATPRQQQNMPHIMLTRSQKWKARREEQQAVEEEEDGDLSPME